MTAPVRPLAAAAVFGTALLLAPAGAQDKKEPAKPAATKGTLADKLARTVTLDKVEGKFGDVVRDLAEKYDLPLVIDHFSATGPEDGDNTPVENAKVRLSKLVNVRLGTALRLLCDQVHGTYLVRPDHVRIVNELHALNETGVTRRPDPDDPNETPPFLSEKDQVLTKPLIHRALVTAAYRKVPLADVLDDIAESTGANVVLSPEVGPKAQAEVAARFANTPVDAAVRTLCELTDLGVIEDANVLVVTTRERAAARAKADDERRKALRPPTPIMVGPNVTGAIFPTPVDLGAELTRVREQNDKLLKEVEELRKTLKK